MNKRMTTHTDFNSISWLSIVRLAGNERTIQALGRKNLVLYLAQRLRLSVPTMNALLAIWTEEGKIEVKKTGFPKKPTSLKIISLKECPLPLMPKKVLWLIDFDNLVITAKGITLPMEAFSIELGFERVKVQLTEEIGEIIAMFAFLPPERTMVYAKELDKLGLTIITCPKRQDEKTGEEKDATDPRLLELGEWLIDNIDGLTHICLGSGDVHFKPLLEKAGQKGLKRAVVVSDLNSLSSEILKLVDIHPKSGKKMVYIFSPTKE